MVLNNLFAVSYCHGSMGIACVYILHVLTVAVKLNESELRPLYPMLNQDKNQISMVMIFSHAICIEYCIQYKVFSMSFRTTFFAFLDIEQHCSL